MESGVSTQQLDNFNILPFWKKNESLLKQIEESPTPAKSRLVFKDVATSQDASGGHIVTSFDLVNVYDNRKNFLSIIAYLSPDGSSVLKEEIIAGNKLSSAKRTVIDGSRITNKDQVEWIKEMSRNSSHRLFRAT